MPFPTTTGHALLSLIAYARTGPPTNSPAK